MGLRAVRSKKKTGGKNARDAAAPKRPDTPRNYTEIVSHRTNGSSSEQSLAGPRRQQPPQRRESFGRGALLAPRLNSRGRHLGELSVAQQPAPRRQFGRRRLDEAPEHVRHVAVRPVLRDALPGVVILDARHGRADRRLRGLEEARRAVPFQFSFGEPLEVRVL